MVGRLALEFAELTNRHAELSDRPSAANKLFDKIRVVGARLRSTPAGRASLEALLAHPSPYVRTKAAFQTLAWDSPAGIAAFELIRDSEELNRLPGMLTMNAEYTLIEYRKGALKFPV